VKSFNVKRGLEGANGHLTELNYLAARAWLTGHSQTIRLFPLPGLR